MPVDLDKAVRSLRLALVAGAVIAVVTAGVMPAWDWLETPAGIFHGPDGTRWDFVFDTAVSWVVPTFLHATVVAFCAHLLWTRLVGLKTRNLSRSVRPDRDPRKS